MDLIDDILLPGSLWCIMLAMGLSLTIGDFKRIFVNRRALLLGVASMLVIPPVVGVLIAVSLAPTPALAVGFVLLATCPGGMVSNLMTDLSKGDLALSLSMSIVVSAIYIFVVPIYAYLTLQYFMGIDQTVEVPLDAFIWKILSITLVPVCFGLLIRHFKQSLAEAVRGYIKLLAMSVLVFAFVTILIDQVAVLQENFWSLFWMTLGMNLVVLALAFALTRVFGCSQSETSAVCIEHLIRQEGTAIFIAVAIVGNREMSLPMIMNTPVGLFLCILLVSLMRKYMKAHPGSEAAPAAGKL